jgi:hypothetical protein
MGLSDFTTCKLAILDMTDDSYRQWKHSNLPAYRPKRDLKQTTQEIKLSLLRNAFTMAGDRLLGLIYIMCGGAALSWWIGEKITELCGIDTQVRLGLVSSQLLHAFLA